MRCSGVVSTCTAPPPRPPRPPGVPPASPDVELHPVVASARQARTNHNPDCGAAFGAGCRVIEGFRIGNGGNPWLIEARHAQRLLINTSFIVICLRHVPVTTRNG